jgi:hypothetical protein
VIHRAGAIILVALALAFSSAGRAQSPAGAVVLPPNTDRPPVALIVAASDAAGPMANDLQTNGIASLYVAPTTAGSDEDRVRRITDQLMALRNDARFPTLVVIGQGTAARDAAIAARAVRADGFVAIASENASAEISRLVAEVLNSDKGVPTSKEIAAFARNVSALGRRGTRERRPDSPRQSPRTLTIATVGGSLVGIEYGQPQKRPADADTDQDEESRQPEIGEGPHDRDGS